jgi:thiamine kinase-like enzyme
MVDRQKIEQLFKVIGKEVNSISFLGKGEASNVLKIESNDGIYSLKTALYPRRMKKVLNEVNFRNYFINRGLTCIPAPMHADSEIFPYGAVIYKYNEGNQPNFKNLDVLKQFARILGEIHKIKYELVEEGYNQLVKVYENLEKVTESIVKRYPHFMNTSIISAFSLGIEEFKEFIKSNQLSTSIGINAQLHGDLSNNFIIDPEDKIWLIDWENSEFGDIVDEICWFLYINEISYENYSMFFQEYQNTFKQSQKIKFEDLARIYFASYPVFDICWGIDQMATQIEHNLESPTRKLKDLATSAKEWSNFYSNSTSSLIVNGIKELDHSLLG